MFSVDYLSLRKGYLWHEVEPGPRDERRGSFPHRTVRPWTLQVSGPTSRGRSRSRRCCRCHTRELLRRDVASSCHSATVTRCERGRVSVYTVGRVLPGRWYGISLCGVFGKELSRPVPFKPREYFHLGRRQLWLQCRHTDKYYTRRLGCVQTVSSFSLATLTQSNKTIHSYCLGRYSSAPRR